MNEPIVIDDFIGAEPWLWNYHRLKWALEARTGDIDIHFNTKGGDPDEAIAMVSLLQTHEGNVTGTVIGACSSAGTIALMGCDVRRCVANGRVLAHATKAYAHGALDQKALDSISADLRVSNQQQITTFATATGKSEDEVWEMLQRDQVMTAEEAKDYGLIHEVLPMKTKLVACDTSHLPDFDRYRGVDQPLAAVEKKSFFNRLFAGDQSKEVTPMAESQTPAENSAIDLAKLRAEVQAEERAKLQAELAETHKTALTAAEESARKAVQAEYQSIHSLCAIAGMPNKAADYITAGKTSVEVQAELLALKAASDPKDIDNGVDLSGGKKWSEMTITEQSALNRSNPALAAKLRGDA